MTGPTQHFLNLGAPLRNYRWSWGAQRPDGVIFLRAWDDEIIPIDGKEFIRLTNHAVYANGAHPGYRERVRHIDEIRGGASAYVVICHAIAPKQSNRRLKSFEQHTLTRIASIQDHNGNLWAELGDVVPVARVAN